MKVCLQELIGAATPAPEASSHYPDDYEMLYKCYHRQCARGPLQAVASMRAFRDGYSP